MYSCQQKQCNGLLNIIKPHSVVSWIRKNLWFNELANSLRNYENNGFFNKFDSTDVHPTWKCNNHSNEYVKNKIFPNGKGVKQGCPLAHCLYLLVANVWSVMFVDLTYPIHGLTLPNGYILQDLFFC
jgi:hypothetical protein